MRKHLEFRIPNPAFLARRFARRSTFDPASFNYEADAQTLARMRELSMSGQKDFPDRQLLFVYGVMPRSGTNFLFEMLLRMPGAERAAIGFDELPILLRPQVFEEPTAMMRGFHPPSADAMPRLAWLAFAAAGLRNHLLEASPAGSLTLVKEPHPNNVALFPAVFPKDHIVIVLRDGRYVVDSFLRSFARTRLSRSFAEICEEFRAAAETVASFLDSEPENTMAVRYEEANRHRADTVEKVLSWLGRETDPEALAALSELPIYGSSIQSRASSGEVDWTPVKPDASFDPSRRQLDWTPRQRRTFERIAGAANRRLGYE